MADFWVNFKQVCPDYQYSKEETFNQTTAVLLDFLRYILMKVHRKTLEVCFSADSETLFVDFLSNFALIKHINELIPSTDFKLSILDLARPKSKKVTHIIRYLMHLICACHEHADDVNSIIKKCRERLEDSNSFEQDRKALLIVNHNHTIEEMKMREAIGLSKSNVDRMNEKYLSATTSEHFKTNSNNINVIKEGIATKTDSVKKLRESIEMYKTNEAELNEVQSILCKLTDDCEAIKVDCASLDNIIFLKQKHFSHLQNVSNIATTFSTYVQDFKDISTTRKELQKKVEINADMKAKLKMTEMQIVDKVSVMNEIKEMYVKKYKKQMHTYIACSTKVEESMEEGERIKEEKQKYSKQLKNYMLNCEMIEEEIKSNEIEFDKHVSSLFKFHDDVIEMEKHLLNPDVIKKAIN